MRITSAKFAAAAAAVAVSAGLFAAAPAQSQTANFENLMKVAAQADSISCSDLKVQLDKTGRVNANTTRADLVNMANAELAKQPSHIRAAAGPTVQKVANRAVACGLVKSGNGSNSAPAQSPTNRAPGKPATSPARPATPAPANPVDQIVSQVNQAISNPAQLSSDIQSQIQGQIDAYRAQVNAVLPMGSSI